MGATAVRTAGALLGVTGYVYAGYPALITALAAVHPRRPSPVGDLPAITVLIAAYNEADCIADRVADVLAQGYPEDRLDLVVVADGSDDATVAIASAASPRVRVLHRPERMGKAAALHRAIPQARHGIVVVTDANNRFAPGSLEALVAPFGDPTVGAVSGRKSVVGGDGDVAGVEGAYWRYESLIKEAESWVGCCTSMSGEVLAIRRDLVRPIPPGVALDDFWFLLCALRAGTDVRYAPDAVSIEATSATEGDELERRVKIAAGRWQLLGYVSMLPLGRPLVCVQLASHKFGRLFLPFTMAGAFVASALAARRPGPNRRRAWGLLAPQLAFYAAALAPRPSRPPLLRRALYVPRYLLRSNATAVVGLARLLRGADLARWRPVQRHRPGG